ncbi:hypothetical protein FNV43_RR21853 [Rhamnella rubrinervis]|uniref:Major facilitator superfamily (MFS) profile domain-containing protein n=1 Tax=Rhamnella rubrinervis TaxID=2594499 RepID=A0A8K0E0T6_9ROSA|nr:hypothetical protein FNV43_RR21853 [Rhamnella rubrinervis]
MEKLRSLNHLFVTVFLSVFGGSMVVPAITDVTMSALCPGKDECSLAIYLTGFQQAIIGLGTVVMSPLMGNLSDKYGRKSLLTLPMTLSIIPQVILAFKRTTNYFYAYFVLRTITAMVAGGSIECLTLAYVADNIGERERASAFGILAGVRSAAFVCGTLAARFLSTSSTFQVAALATMIATVYMRVFLEESLPYHVDHNLTQPILIKASSTDDHEPGDQDITVNIVDDHEEEEEEDDHHHHDGQTPPKKTMQVSNKKFPSLQDIISLLTTSKTFSQAAIVSFFQSLADGGIDATLLYFLKARFHFNKNQFADLLLIIGITGTISQLLLMPLVAPVLGEEKLLSIGLLVGSANMFVQSISWSVWVPYAATLFSAFAVFAYPTIRSIASKQFASSEQGKAQGCISGVSSFANIVSPLIFSPLTALFLSEGAPIHFPGFTLMCIGIALMIAFIQSTMIKAVPAALNQKIGDNCLE